MCMIRTSSVYVLSTQGLFNVRLLPHPAACNPPPRRLASAQVLLQRIESHASDVATASAAATTRRRELEQQQEELKKNLKVRPGF